MAHWVRVMVAVLLIPLCLGASRALVWVLVESGRPNQVAEAGATQASAGGAGEVSTREARPFGTTERELRKALSTWVPLLAGAACWVVLYLMVPRPTWVYVFGHELTHVIWGWLFEAKVKKFHVSSKGGHVILSKVNFLILLAPYFFPLYALILASAYGVAGLFMDLEAFRVWFLLLLGAAFCFHATFTYHALNHEQTDITSVGWFFAVVVIWLGNLAILVPGLSLLLGVSVPDALREWGWGTWQVYTLVVGPFQPAF